MTKAAMFGVVVALAAGTAFAGEPLVLTAEQMDKLTAGQTSSNTVSVSCVNGACAVNQTSTGAGSFSMVTVCSNGVCQVFQSP